MKHSSDAGFADVVIGMQHGDEGKGRYIDILAGQYDWVARYNGGNNAGHTVIVNGQKLALNAIPSGVHHPGAKLYIAAHCVVDPVHLCAEIDRVEQAGIHDLPQRLRISPQASVIQPACIVLDRHTTRKSIGSTGKGIGQTYAWQDLRKDEDGRQLDIHMGNLTNGSEREWALATIRKNLEVVIERLSLTKDQRMEYGVEDIDAVMEKLKTCIERIESMIETDPFLLTKEVRRGARILMEGAQAFALDRTFGITPNVTASNTGVAAAFVSTGVPVDYKRHAWGVAKLIPSRVGRGPFVPEFGGSKSEEYCMKDNGDCYRQEVEQRLYDEHVMDMLKSADPMEVGIALRMRGGEYGATTGRPRRIGMLDEVQLRYAIEPNGLDGLLLTKGDCLADFARTRNGMIPVVTGYKLNGKDISYMPTTNEELATVKPKIEYFDGFPGDISKKRTIKDLPPSLVRLLAGMRDRLGVELIAMGVSPERNSVVMLNGHKLF